MANPIVPQVQVPNDLPPVADLGALPGIRQTAPPRTLSFAQLYGDESKDPCHRVYTRIMNRFDAERPDALPSAVLYNQVVGLGGTTLQAYLICAHAAQGPRIYCLHTPGRYVEALDGTSTPWDNNSYAFLGEVIRGQVSIANFPENAFDEVTVRVKTEALMLQNLALLEQHPVFPPNPPNPDDPEVIEVITRRAMYLPAVYVPLCLSASGYSAKQMWEILYPALVQRQETVVCAPLIRWLQAASTGRQLQDPLSMGPPSLLLPLISPPADEHLLTNRQGVLQQMLPQLSDPPQSLETALTHMAAALIGQTNETRQAREIKLAQDVDPKLPSDRFKVTLPILIEYLQVQNEDDLPPLWHRWANCTKKQDIQVLSDTLHTFARSADAFSASVPIVTARLVQDLLMFNFLGQSIDDIKSGLHPFIILDGNAENRQANLETARLYGLLTAGDATISLADLETLTAKETRSVPLTYWELEKSLGMFGNLIAVVLGSNHVLTVAFRDLWTLLQSSARDDIHSAIEYNQRYKPAHILRSIQITFYTWFMHRRSKLTPPTPDLKCIVHQIMMQVYITPILPPELHKLANPKKLLSSSGSSFASSVPGTIGTASLTIPTGTSSSSVVSGLTNPTPPTRGSAVFNLQPNATLQSLLPSNIKIRELVGNTSPPQFDAGGEMCISFLVRNTCWTNCKRASQHRANLTAGEQTRLEQHLTNQMQGYTARRAQRAPVSTATSQSQG